jgi:hypothetical protein
VGVLDDEQLVGDFAELTPGDEVFLYGQRVGVGDKAKIAEFKMTHEFLVPSRARREAL